MSLPKTATFSISDVSMATSVTQYRTTSCCLAINTDNTRTDGSTACLCFISFKSMFKFDQTNYEVSTNRGFFSLTMMTYRPRGNLIFVKRTILSLVITHQYVTISQIST